MITVPKGTKDVLPGESHKWQYAEGLLRETAALFNLKEIRTPVFEHTELFLRGIGEGTDVVSKEMYTFCPAKSDRSITLKPEGTAPVARSVLENSLDGEGLPVKLYYITPVFRYEQPQAGRLREHHQFGAEIYGSPSPMTDAEAILLAHTLLKRLRVTAKLYINSIGCKECRAAYREALINYFRPKINGMCASCRERLDKNPLRILDCKCDVCKKEAENAPKTIDFLCDDCSAHMDALKSHLQAADVAYEINPNIVRGLDYYNRTVFEFVTTALGAQGTVCGGGRYDGLTESVDGKALPAVGFGMGLERILMLMEAENAFFPEPPKIKLFIASMGAKAESEAFKKCAELRENGVPCDFDGLGRSVKAQMRTANRLGAEYSVVLGDNELETGSVKIKNMLRDETLETTLSGLVDFIKKL